MKTKIDPVNKREPKPPKKYPNILRPRWVGGGDGLFGPYLVVASFSAPAVRPSVGDVFRRSKRVSGVMVCQSSPARSRQSKLVD